MEQAFVTGACGFIGSHLVEALLDHGWSVKALVHYNSRGSRGWMSACKDNAEGRLNVVLGDVTDAAQVAREMAGSTHVFHLGALVGIPYSYAAPSSYVNTNIIGTHNLIRAALDNGVSRFIHTSTSEVYGTACYTPIDEKHPLQAQSPYAATKIAGDKLVESYFCSFDLPAITVRPFNTFGPRQSARAVIPTIISQALHRDELRLGSLEPCRDFTYVTDTVAGFIAAAIAPENTLGQVYNLGTGDGVRIAELVQHILAVVDRDLPVICDPERKRPEKSEVFNLLSNNSRACNELPWQPQISLQQGLERTVNWMREHPDYYDPDDYST